MEANKILQTWLWFVFISVITEKVELSTQETFCSLLKKECSACNRICEGHLPRRIDCRDYCNCNDVNASLSKSEESCERHCTENATVCRVTCRDGFFGGYCEHDCSKNCRNKMCSQTTGHCSEGCSNGYYGDTCQHECNRKCRHDICDRDSGRCTFLCKDGYFGLRCDEQCPDDCFVCGPENSTCVITESPHDDDLCFPCVVLICVLALTVIVVMAVIAYRCGKCSCKSRCHARDRLEPLPPLDLSQFALESYIPENVSKRISRSTGYLEDASIGTLTRFNPSRTFMRFKFPYTDRRSRSLCSLKEYSPSYWVGEGQNVHDLFEEISPDKDDDVFVSPDAATGESSTATERNAGILKQTHNDGNQQSTMERAESAKGYIHPVFK